MADLTANIVDRLDRGIGLTDLTTQGTALTEVTNSYRNDGNIVAFVINGSGAPITATLKSQPDSFGRGGAGDTDNDETLTVAAGDLGMFPFHSGAMFNATGVCTLDVSAFASVSVLLVRIRKAR